jgi:hypothetical protein
MPENKNQPPDGSPDHQNQETGSSDIAGDAAEYGRGDSWLEQEANGDSDLLDTLMLRDDFQKQRREGMIPREIADEVITEMDRWIAERKKLRQSPDDEDA